MNGASFSPPKYSKLDRLAEWVNDHPIRYYSCVVGVPFALRSTFFAAVSSPATVNAAAPPATHQMTLNGESCKGVSPVRPTADPNIFTITLPSGCAAGN
jgi:hypothetical protein